MMYSRSVTRLIREAISTSTGAATAHPATTLPRLFFATTSGAPATASSTETNLPLKRQFNTESMEMPSQCPFHAAFNQPPSPPESTGCPMQQPRQPEVPVTGLPFEKLPTPRGLPLVGNLVDLIKAGGSSYVHRYCDKRHQELGSIYREKLGDVDVVFISDAELIQKVYSNDGKFPRHMVPEPWTIYNQTKGIQRGLFFMNGQEWSDRRRALNKVLLMPKTVSQYTPVFNEVISDILEDYRQTMEASGEQAMTMDDLEKQLYNWSIESLGAMIFGRRLGCIPTKNNAEAADNSTLSIHEFVDCVQNIFIESANMQLMPPKLAYRLKLPVWRRFEKAAGRALELAFDYVNENAQRSSLDLADGKEMSIIEQMRREGQMGLDEISRIIVDLFIAAADTTSHATQWALYLLARNKDVQGQLYQEIQKATGGEDVQEKHLQSLGYVKGVIKESLRLYPVAPFLTRYLSDDLNLGGYHIPKGQLVVISLYTTGRLEKYFENAQQFNPARWVRDEETGRHQVWNSYACLPFGLGIRSCIGRRVAEVQMLFLISRLVQRYHIKQVVDEEIDIKLRMITTPEKTINLSITKREPAEAALSC